MSEGSGKLNPISPSWWPSLVSLACSGLACGLQSATGGMEQNQTYSLAGTVAMFLAAGGMILAGYSVSLQPRNLLVLLLAAVSCALAYFGIRAEWDSVRLLAAVMSGVALSALAILGITQLIEIAFVHLFGDARSRPSTIARTLQRVIVSCFVIWHFLGVLSAITSPPPQSWLSGAAWTNLFRPHLMFAYANNAYQFYSPEPGPASLLWFCVELKDGDKTEKVWYKVPRKPETHLDPLAVEFYRRLSITEATNQTYNNGPTTQVYERRQRELTIPHHPKAGLTIEYRPVQELARRTLASYARHVAFLFDPELDKDPNSDRVQGIKIYRVLHDMLKPKDFAEKKDPFEITTYYPYFLGEYDAKGQLKNPNDPMLYWIVPILKFKPSPSSPYEIKNFLVQHAGSDPFEETHR
ncbi:MAG: hypothetical protein ACJ8C4_03465 [Gemmataceae bacterium]